MTPQGSFPRPPKPKAASPAERSAEFAETQQRLKSEAAERRAQAAKGGTSRRPAPTGSRRHS
jgi:hypothetical protein